MDLRLAPGILEEAIEQARTAYPREACGLLVGRGMAGRLVAITNISDNAQEFEMEPSELVAVLRDLRGSGEELVGIFHSHPNGPAKPSPTDVARAYYPEAAQLIVSLADVERPETAAFRIVDGQVFPVELHVIV